MGFRPLLKKASLFKMLTRFKDCRPAFRRFRSLKARAGLTTGWPRDLPERRGRLHFYHRPAPLARICSVFLKSRRRPGVGAPPCRAMKPARLDCHISSRRGKSVTLRWRPARALWTGRSNRHRRHRRHRRENRRGSSSPKGPALSWLRAARTKASRSRSDLASVLFAPTSRSSATSRPWSTGPSNGRAGGIAWSTTQAFPRRWSASPRSTWRPSIRFWRSMCAACCWASSTWRP